MRGRSADESGRAIIASIAPAMALTELDSIMRLTSATSAGCCCAPRLSSFGTI